jgi:cobaltochelatase CobN
MHRIAATPGGWNPDMEGVVFVDQTPAPIVFLTAADTEIQTLARAIAHLPQGFPALRGSNLLHLQQQLTIDTYAETVLAKAEIIVVRLLGGQAYWSYGLEVLQETVARTGAKLLLLPGDDRPDPALLSASTVPLRVVNQMWRYWVEGGVENARHSLLYLADACLGRAYHPPDPQPIPRVGRYGDFHVTHPTAPGVGILFYRAHYLSGNTAVIDALCASLKSRHLNPVPLFLSSLRDEEVQRDLADHFRETPVDLILNTTGFSLARFDDETPQVGFWQRLDVPVLQVILSGGTEAQWQEQWRGLSPRDVAMNVALPEVDGRIISRAISFKAIQTRHPDLETEVVGYEPVGDRLNFVADLAANWATLRRTPVAQRRVALILANYPNRDGRLANGVGLDTPASCVDILKAMQQDGYTIPKVPQDAQELMQWLTAGVTNDPEGQEIRPVYQSLSDADYAAYFHRLPPSVRQGIVDRWGEPQVKGDRLPIAGIQLGHVFVGIQPARGYDLDPTLNYHAPDLEPPHTYLAFYHWVRSPFAAQAIIHVGKHGNLEWLPGKSVALSEGCYPEVALGALPHLYPFIVNDPGEGSQAKRRAQAVILDHLTPPLTRAELYGGLHRLERLVDEYHEAASLDPVRLPIIRDRIQALIAEEHLDRDLAQRPMMDVEAEPDSFETLLTRTDAYLCDLKEAQIRDGLHIFGQCPQGQQLRDLILAIARSPGRGRLGLTRAIAQDWGWTLDPLSPELGNPLTAEDVNGTIPAGLRTWGDAVEQLEQHAANWIEVCVENHPIHPEQIHPEQKRGNRAMGSATQAELTWIQTTLLPALHHTQDELTNLLRGLDGRYVPSGASGAPTRGRADVLPTGRNFYSVDIRSLPTETAWNIGRRAAETLIERYTQEQGEYPKTLGLSVWGTSTMRTGGDDIAEAFALIGVRPVWEGASRRVIDFEILPLSVLGRPRVDVTLRISGFFRDAFPNLIDLFDAAVQAVGELTESPDDNPIAAQMQAERAQWQAAGFSPEQAAQQASYRVFGSKPGAYGAGLQGLIEAQNWTDDRDLAQAYINWSCYAYRGARGNSEAAPPTSAATAFEQRLQQMQIVLHNQDNREHDLLDSDDYYQFQGGLTAAVRSLQGQNPTVYFGDHSRPDYPRVRSLREELARVYRSRVVNPKWIAGVMRHGYKGAFEMAATVDYLFAYSATTHCVEDFMYEGVAQAYVLEETVQQFVQTHNPWALRDMAERLIEAQQRGLWQNASPDLIDQLRAIAHQAEAQIEGIQPL